MKTIALIEKGKDGVFGIFTPELESTIIGTGTTVAEAKTDFQNSLNEVLALYAKLGKELPDELKNVEFEYKWDIASLFEYFNWINVSKFAKTVGITPSLMRYYKNNDAYISEAQAKKIEHGLHKAARELLSISL